VKYHVFAQILALSGAIKSTNPIRQLVSSCYSAYNCLIGIVVLIALLHAMNLAKSLIVSKKNYFNHRAPMQWNGDFWPKISPIFAFRLHRSIRYSRAQHALWFYLGNRTTAHREYLMGSTVNNLLKFWVYKLSFLKRHLSIQKGKKWNSAHFCSKTEYWV
jgi:hypothetical protein